MVTVWVVVYLFYKFCTVYLLVTWSMFAKWQSLHCGVFVCEPETYLRPVYLPKLELCCICTRIWDVLQHVLIPNHDICTCISEALWSTVKLCCAVLRGQAGRPARSAPQWPQHFMCSLSGHQGNNNHDDHDDDDIYIMMWSVCLFVCLLRKIITSSKGIKAMFKRRRSDQGISPKQFSQ